MRVLRETNLYYFWEVIETELRAWVENPLAHWAGEPVYLLGEIRNIENGIADIKILGDAISLPYPIEKVHCVHEYAPLYNRVVKIHGEPKGTV